MESVVRRKLRNLFIRLRVNSLYFARFDFRTAMRACFSNRFLSRRRPRGTPYFVPCGRGVPEMKLRARTTDASIFEQIFLQRDCWIPFDLKPRFIIDGGAHVGCSAVFFAQRYPEATILAIEAERSNFALLQENTAEYPHVKCLNAAVWKNREGVQLEDSAVESWGFRVREAGDAPKAAEPRIPSFAIDDLLAMSGHDRIDLLKLDIEGAEAEVFSGDCGSWMPKTGAIVLELHDRFRPGCDELFRAAARQFSFEQVPGMGDNVIVRRRE